MKNFVKSVGALCLCSLALLLFAACGADDKEGDGESSKEAPKKVLQTVSVSIPGMTWAVGWTPRVEDALNSLPGVGTVEVMMKSAKVTYEEGKCSEMDILAALTAAGFKDSDISK